MAVAKVLSNLKHDGVAYYQGDTVEADLSTLKDLESAGVVGKVIDAVEGEVVEPTLAVEAQASSDEQSKAEDKSTESKPAVKKDSSKK